MKAWKVSNPHLSMQFERRTSNTLCLESWVDAAKLSKMNHLQDVCSRGFHMPESGKGLTFHTGKIHIDHPPAENGQYSFLLCKIGVGKSFVLDDPNDKQELPEGYDSFYVHKPEENSQTDDYHHEYIIPEASQVLPQYIVHFNYTPRNTQPIGDANSRRQRFRVDINAVRQKVREALSVLGPEAEDQTERMLQQMTDKYETALNASQQHDPLLEERKRGIEDTISSISDKVSEIQENHKAVEDEIYRRMQEVLHQLNSNTEKKIAVLLGEELELRRQKQQIDWTEDFVPILRESLPPMEFIKAWDKHQAMRSALYSQAGGRLGMKQSRAVLDQVKGDLQLVGHVEVVSESDVDHYMDNDESQHRTMAPTQEASKSWEAPMVPYKYEQPFVGAQGPGGTDWYPGSPTDARNTVQETWKQFLSENNLRPESEKKATPPSATVRSPVPPASKGNGTVPRSPPVDIDEAERRVRRAKDELSNVESFVRSLPPSQRRYGEQLLQEQREELNEVEKQRAALLRNEPRSDFNRAYGDRAGLPKNESIPRSPYVAHDYHGNDSSSRGRMEESAMQVGGAPATQSTRAVAESKAADKPRNQSTVAQQQKSLEGLLERYSLTKVADTRARSLGEELNNVAVDYVFADSRIIGDGEIARTLYLNLPFRQATPMYDDAEPQVLFPTTKLIYSTFSQHRHATHIVDALKEYEDEHGQQPEATVFLVKSEDRIFGGYASEPWQFDGFYHGSPSSFLFMLSPHEVKIPFHGRVKGPAQETDEEDREEHERQQDEIEQMYHENLQVEMDRLMDEGVEFDEYGNVIRNPYDVDTSKLNQPQPRRKPWIRHDAQRSGSDFIEFGLGDLVLVDDLTECRTELENSYGIGLKRGSPECRSLLSGSNSGQFQVDTVEVWAVEYEEP